MERRKIARALIVSLVLLVGIVAVTAGSSDEFREKKTYYSSTPTAPTTPYGSSSPTPTTPYTGTPTPTTPYVGNPSPSTPYTSNPTPTHGGTPAPKHSSHKKPGCGTPGRHHHSQRHGHRSSHGHSGGYVTPTPSYGGGNPTPSHGGNYGTPSPSTGTGGNYGTPSPSTGGGGSYGTPSPSIGSGGSYTTPTPSTPSGGSYGTPRPSTPISTPTTPGFSTPDPSSNNFPGTCAYWKTHPEAIWALFGHWGDMSQFFGAGCSAIFGHNLSLIDALSNTRQDGYGALFREGTASFLNSLVNKRFPISTMQVRDAFASALASNQAAASQAELFKKANEGRFKL